VDWPNQGPEVVPLHFTRKEFAEGCEQALEAMAARGLDALLTFKQESTHWFAGYDVFGQCCFECLMLRARVISSS
jgi:Xaa-Pro dipeptidase